MIHERDLVAQYARLALVVADEEGAHAADEADRCQHADYDVARGNFFYETNRIVTATRGKDISVMGRRMEVLSP